MCKNIKKNYTFTHIIVKTTTIFEISIHFHNKWHCGKYQLKNIHEAQHYCEKRNGNCKKWSTWQIFWVTSTSNYIIICECYNGSEEEFKKRKVGPGIVIKFIYYKRRKTQKVSKFSLFFNLTISHYATIWNT